MTGNCSWKSHVLSLTVFVCSVSIATDRHTSIRIEKLYLSKKISNSTRGWYGNCTFGQILLSNLMLVRALFCFLGNCGQLPRACDSSPTALLPWERQHTQCLWLRWTAGLQSAIQFVRRKQKSTGSSSEAKTPGGLANIRHSKRWVD